MPYKFNVFTGALDIVNAAASASGLVLVVHKAGTSTTYNAASDTDTARGTALLAASSAMATGDTLYLSAHTFDIGTGKVTLLDSCSIYGSGKYSTIVQGVKLNDHVIQCASNTTTADMSIKTTSTTGDGSHAYLVWGNKTATVTNVTLRDVYILGTTDCVYLTNGSNSTVNIYNVDAVSNWDAFYSTDTGTINIYNSNFTATATTGVNGGHQTDAVFNNEGGTLNLFDVTATATGADINNFAFYNKSGTTNIYSGKATTSGTNPIDLLNDTGSINVTGVLSYSTSKVSALPAITYLDANPTLKSIGAATDNFGIRTLSPRGAFDLMPRNHLDTPIGGALNFSYGGTATGTYDAEGDLFGVNVYAYKTVSAVKYYSAIPLNITGTDNGSSAFMSMTFSWAALAGVDGYRITFYDPLYIGSNYDVFFDTASTSITFGGPTRTEDTYSTPVVITPTGLGGDLYFDTNGTVIATSFGLNVTGQPGFTPNSVATDVFNIKNSGRSIEIETTDDPYGSGVNKGVKMTLVNEDFHNGALFKNKSLDLVDFQFSGASTTFGAGNNLFSTIRWEGRAAYVQGSGNTTRGELQLGSTVDSGGVPAFFVGEGTMGLSRGKFSVRSPSNAPTAYLHIGAGTAAATTAPLKFTSGTLMTTAEAGGYEFLTDKFYGTITTGAARKEFTLNDAALTSGKIPVATTNGRLTDSTGTGYAKVSSGTISYQATPIPVADGGTGQTVSRRLFTHFADAGNGTTVETDLYSDSIAAGKLTNNGDMIEAEYAGVFVSSGTATRQVKIYFGGTAIFDTGALTLSLSAAWTAYVNIIRVSSSVVRYAFSFTTEGAALAAYTAVGELTGLTLANAQVMKITGQAAGIGAATNDIVAKLGYIDYESI